MRHGYGVRQSVPYGVASLVRSPLRTSLGSLRSERSNGALLASDGPAAGTRGGFVLNFHSDGEAGEKKRGLFRRGSLFGSLQRLRKSESRSSVCSKRSSAPSETALSGISSSDGNSAGSVGDGDPAEDDWTREDGVDAAVTESYAGEWQNDKRNGFGVSERSDGLKYRGEWLNNKRHGYGATVFPGGAGEEGKYKNNVLVRGVRKHFIPLKDAKTKRKVDRAVEGAARAAAVARTKVEIAISRYARVPADTNRDLCASSPTAGVFSAKFMCHFRFTRGAVAPTPSKSSIAITLRAAHLETVPFPLGFFSSLDIISCLFGACCFSLPWPFPPKMIWTQDHFGPSPSTIV